MMQSNDYNVTVPYQHDFKVKTSGKGGGQRPEYLKNFDRNSKRNAFPIKQQPNPLKDTARKFESIKCIGFFWLSARLNFNSTRSQQQ